MKRVVIIGGGIGGLTAAIALRRRGIEATVFERAQELREAGAALVLASNAVKALERLGLAGEVCRLGVTAGRWETRSWRGEVLSAASLAEVWERMGAESVGVHRAGLQATLLGALGEDAVHLGAKMHRGRAR